MPDDPTRALVSMGIYIASLNYLSSVLSQDASNTSSSHDFGNDIIPKVLDGGHQRFRSKHRCATVSMVGRNHLGNSGGNVATAAVPSDDGGIRSRA